jgi:hypothetical protein
MNEITVKWNKINTEGITLPTTTKINTVLLAHDEVITADSEDNLQSGVFSLQNTANNFGMEISSEKSETMAFLGQDPVRFKITVGSKRLQQVKNLNISIMKIPMKMKKILTKLAKFAQILGLLSNNFKPTLIQKSSKIKAYNALALPIHLNGSKI